MSFLSLRPVSCALLLISLVLTASSTRAGTYIWSKGTNPNTGNPIQSPNYTGGQVTADGRIISNSYQYFSTIDSLTGVDTYGFGYSGIVGTAVQDPARTSTATVGGTVSAVFTWQAAYAGEPFPQSVIVVEHCVPLASLN